MPALAHQVEQERIDEGDFAVAQAGGRLVEQQKPRVAGERAREVEQLLPAEIELAGETVAVGPQPGLLEDLFGITHRLRLGAAPARARAERHVARNPAASSPTRTFSSTVMRCRSSRFWNVRPMPILMTSCGGSASTGAAGELDRCLRRARRSARCN